jgi:hypothetical protein
LLSKLAHLGISSVDDQVRQNVSEFLIHVQVPQIVGSQRL